MDQISRVASRVPRGAIDDITQIHLSTSSANANVGEINKRNRVTFTFEHAIDIPNHHIALMSLTGGQLPHSWYAIGAENNKFILIIGVTSYDITVPPGNYSAKKFGKELRAQILSVTGLPFNIHYNKIINKFEYSIETALAISFDFDVNGAMFLAMGFRRKSYNTFIGTANKTLISTTAVNVNVIDSIHINLADLTFFDVISGGKISNTIHVQYVRSAYNAYETIMVQFIDWKRVTNSSNSFASITVEMIDQYGNDISFNGQDWKLSLMIRIANIGNNLLIENNNA